MMTLVWQHKAHHCLEEFKRKMSVTICIIDTSFGCGRTFSTNTHSHDNLVIVLKVGTFTDGTFTSQSSIVNVH
jgi:hypothetical protein